MIFKFLKRRKPPRRLEPAALEVDGRTVTVRFREHPTAKNVIVRLGHAGDEVVATVPKHISRAAALAFVEKSKGWIAARLGKRRPGVGFSDGARVPLRGEMFKIVGLAAARGTVTIDAAAGELRVPGGADHLARRLAEWLKDEARRDLGAASERYARAMDARIGRIAIRDQKSRWGSCSAEGGLSYSWRLILAPPFVLDYVAAHEVAHLRHMNHGPRFWRLVLAHCPRAGEARDWMKANGRELHRYG